MSVENVKDPFASASFSITMLCNPSAMRSVQPMAVNCQNSHVSSSLAAWLVALLEMRLVVGMDTLAAMTTSPDDERKDPELRSCHRKF